jgi:hypothetical protein
MMPWVRRGLILVPLGCLSAAASAGCPAAPDPAAALPVPLDLTGRPGAAQVLARSAAPTLPAGDPGCGPARPSEARSVSPDADSSEALHGLPEPDLQPRIDMPTIR